jgi:hypothetical protein
VPWVTRMKHGKRKAHVTSHTHNSDYIYDLLVWTLLCVVVAIGVTVSRCVGRMCHGHG